MPQLIGIILIGVVVWYGYCALKREMDRIDRENRDAEQQMKEAKKGKELVRGDDGVYRPPSPDDD